MTKLGNQAGFITKPTWLPCIVIYHLRTVVHGLVRLSSVVSFLVVKSSFAEDENSDDFPNFVNLDVYCDPSDRHTSGKTMPRLFWG